MLPCSASVQQNCLLSYTLIDTTTGKTIATIPIDEFQYEIPNAAHDTYSLVVNLQVLPGQLLQSDPVTAVAK